MRESRAELLVVQMDRTPVLKTGGVGSNPTGQSPLFQGGLMVRHAPVKRGNVSWTLTPGAD